MNRRHFMQQSLILAAGALAACSTPQSILGKAKPRVVVIGGGYAGASVAKYIRLWSQYSIEVIVVEPNPYFISCPLSNLVLGGSKTMADLSFEYEGLAKNHGIQWVT
jgi:sulfide dehydrogenase [flavocytochrome c] flavoprotein chain